jgi:hypothetical protein
MFVTNLENAMYTKNLGVMQLLWASTNKPSTTKATIFHHIQQPQRLMFSYQT